MAVTKTVVAALVLISLLMGTGCCGKNGQCGNPWQAFSTNTVIPPPATNSLSVAGKAPAYYNPAATAANPASAGTIPAGSTVPNSGWAPTGVPANTAPSVNGSFSSYSSSPTSNYQTVTTSTIPSGSTQVVSPDFTTTQVDERTDPSRMPVADATTVQAPSSYQSYGTFHPSNQYSQAYNPYGTFNPNGYAPNPSPTVLASASTAPQANPNYQNGWRPYPPTGPTSYNR